MFCECFLLFVFEFCSFFVITTVLTDCRGHWRIPLLFCAYELHGFLVLSGALFLDVVGQSSCSRPFLVVAVSGRPLHEVFAGSSISCLHQNGRGESTHVAPNSSSQLSPAGHRWLDRDRKALVFADRGFRRDWRLQNPLRRLTVIHRIRTRGCRGGRPISFYTTTICSRARHDTTTSSAGVSL